MGLGGYLTWTAAFREISQAHNNDILLMPVESNGNVVTKVVKSPVFENNPYLSYDANQKNTRLISLNNPATNYCLVDKHDRALHVQDKHIIQNICEKFGIENPSLKCDMFFSEEEEKTIKTIAEKLSSEFVTIEPHSKVNYTKNRVYPFEKWQYIVDKISDKIEVVQVGAPDKRVLKNVTDMTGKTSFRQATGLINYSKLFMSTEGGLVHAATSVKTKSVVVITGYQSLKMVAYPQNENVYIGTHGPCGMKILCDDCKKDADNHDPNEILEKINFQLSL